MSMFTEKAIPKSESPAMAIPREKQTSFHTKDERDRRREMAAERLRRKARK